MSNYGAAGSVVKGEGLEKLKSIYKSKPICQVPPGNYGLMPALMCSRQRRKKKTDVHKTMKRDRQALKEPRPQGQKTSAPQKYDSASRFRDLGENPKNMPYLRVLKKAVDYWRLRNHLGTGEQGYKAWEVIILTLVWIPVIPSAFKQLSLLNSYTRNCTKWFRYIVILNCCNSSIY